MAWISPTGHNDPFSDWSNEASAYDDNLATRAYSTGAGWTEFLELSHTGILCNKVRFYANTQYIGGRKITIQVYYQGSWHLVYEGSFTPLTWVEKELPSMQLVTKAQVRLYHGQSGYRRLHEFDFWEVEPSAPGYGNCLGLWKMNDNAANTTVVDSSGNGNDGTTQQNTDQLHTDGKMDGALTFNGTTDYISCGDVCDVGTGDFSLVGWIKTSDSAAGIIDKWVTNPRWYLFIYGANKVRARAIDGDGNDAYLNGNNAITLTDNNWHLVVATFDRSESDGIHVFIDGQHNEGIMVGDLTTVGDIDNTHPLRFSGTSKFAGTMDMLAVFDKVLSDEEIIWLWNGGNGREYLTGSRPLIGGSLAVGKRRLAG